MNFEWDENKAKTNLFKHEVSFDDVQDDLRPEYDFKSLRVRKVGPKRDGFRRQFVQLAPDVAEVFPDTEAVNQALRFLIRIMRENQASLFSTGKEASLEGRQA